MADPELEKIRAQRLAQLQNQYKGDGNNVETQRAQEEQAKAQEDAKNSILSQILDQQARARLNTLQLGKPEKGKMVESMLINMARSGRIGKKITETDLISILEDINQTTQSKSTVKFDRRRAALDSDDDL